MIFTNKGMDPNAPLARRINAAASVAARDEVRAAIVKARGSLPDAARMLGVSVPLVYRYVEGLGLTAALEEARRANPEYRGRGRPPTAKAARPRRSRRVR